MCLVRKQWTVGKERRGLEMTKLHREGSEVRWVKYSHGVEELDQRPWQRPDKDTLSQILVYREKYFSLL